MTEERDVARPTFPHLENLTRVLVEIPDFLTQPMTVTEKIHGFNARVGRDSEGRLWVGTRSQSFDIDDAPAIQGFTAYARTIAGAVGLGVTIYGEWAGRGIQKGVDYGADKRFFVFAERAGDGPVRSSIAVLEEYWKRGITTVPMIGEGPVALDFLDELRKTPSVASVVDGQIGEGVVVAPIYPVFDRFGHQVIAKFKNPAFEEIAKAPTPRTTLDTAAVDAIAAEYVVAERMRHVLDHLKEQAGLDLPFDPLEVQHTGTVLREMFNDVVQDAASEVDALTDDDRKLLGKAINRLAKPLLDEARLEAARDAVEEVA